MKQATKFTVSITCLESLLLYISMLVSACGFGHAYLFNKHQVVQLTMFAAIDNSSAILNTIGGQTHILMKIV